MAGDCLIEIASSSDAAGQAPLLPVIQVNFTLPSLLSVEPGKYVAFAAVADGEKVPEPEVFHAPLEAFENCACSLTPASLAQTIWSAPAAAVGSGLIQTVKKPEEAGHEALLVDVK